MTRPTSRIQRIYRALEHEIRPHHLSGFIPQHPSSDSSCFVNVRASDTRQRRHDAELYLHASLASCCTHRTAADRIVSS